MVPAPTRRQVLTVGGTAAAALAGGYVFAERTTGDPDTLNGWPMSRGNPAGTGYAPDATPPRDGVTVAWKQSANRLLSFGHGPSPVVAAGRVYVVGNELLVLDADSGAVQYREDVSTRAAPVLTPARAYKSPTLAVNTEGSLAGYHADGGVTLLGDRRGNRRWGLSTGETRQFSFGPPTGAHPPVAAEGLVLFQHQETVYAVDASDGTVRWEATGGRARPVVADGSVYAGQNPTGIAEYDLRTGQQQDTIATDNETVTALTAGSEKLLVGTREQVLEIADGAVDWRYSHDEVTVDDGAISVANGVAYTGIHGAETDYLVALDTADGTERWRSETAPESSPSFDPPAVADGVVYVPTQVGDLAAVDTDDGHVRWRFEGDTEHRLPKSPVAIADDRLYMTDGEYVYALEEP